MSTKPIQAMTIALGLVLGLATAIRPAAADEPVVFPDIQRILDAGVIRVALLAGDAAPMIMTDADGAPAGSEPDLARDLAKKLGVEVAFVRSADTYDGVVDVVARKEADIAVSYLSGGMQRARYVFFSQPYIRQSGRLIYNRARFAELKRDYGIEDLRAIADTAVAAELRWVSSRGVSTRPTSHAIFRPRVCADSTTSMT